MVLLLQAVLLRDATSLENDVTPQNDKLFYDLSW